LPVERESFFARARRKVIPVPKEWFKKIERGRFEMGSPDTEAEQYDNEGPTRYVEIGEFEIFTREVTNEQMVAFDKSFQPQEWSGVSSEELPRHPAVKVSWWAAYAYCAWIGARLPSEAEWEYACRAGTKTPFSFGDTIAVEQVNYDGSYPYGQGKKGEYRKRTVPVASLPANPWGLFEMHGNVWEWCEDTYQDTYEKAPTDGSAWVMKGDRFRVLRGGSWDDRARWCRSACRIRRPASARFDCVGFRPARFTTNPTSAVGGDLRPFSGIGRPPAQERRGVLSRSAM
jgi:formylglycine-generating enzyme required for sulfatase activity